MALHTTNIYGGITIADEAVAMVVSKVARECYGVAELLVTVDSRIFIDIYVLIVDGVNVEAVVESLRSAVVYHVERFTGMRVKAVNVHVLGMKL